ncbi:KxYKxGKxW signal peptide domain-containing protein [Limosilactobacillus reuteri]
MELKEHFKLYKSGKQ